MLRKVLDVFLIESVVLLLKITLGTPNIPLSYSFIEVSPRIFKALRVPLQRDVLPCGGVFGHTSIGKHTKPEFGNYHSFQPSRCLFPNM